MSSVVWSECNNCTCSTKHDILHKVNFESDPSEYHYEDIFMMIRCRGCETVAFRKESHDYESRYQIGANEWDYSISIDIYPHFIEGHKSINDIWNVPNIVNSIYKESIVAIQEGAFTLAGLGLRATIEAICNEREITGSNLQKRINGMVKEGLISKKDASRLHSIRFMGNDAAHEIKKSKHSSVLVALKIIEHLITTIYILDKKIKSHLVTTIASLAELLTVLLVNVKSFENGEVITFKKLLGKDGRRIIENEQSLEDEFKQYIDDEKFENIVLVDVPDEKGKIQTHYKIVNPKEKDPE